MFSISRLFVSSSFSCFRWLGIQGGVSHRGAMSVCMFVCLCHRKTPTFECQGDFWSKGVFLKIGQRWHNFQTKTVRALWMFYRPSPFCRKWGELSLVLAYNELAVKAVAVGCWNLLFTFFTPPLNFFFYYYCFYPHWSRESGSLVCRTFLLFWLATKKSSKTFFKESALRSILS